MLLLFLWRMRKMIWLLRWKSSGMNKLGYKIWDDYPLYSWRRIGIFVGKWAYHIQHFKSPKLFAAQFKQKFRNIFRRFQCKTFYAIKPKQKWCSRCMLEVSHGFVRSNGQSLYKQTFQSEERVFLDLSFFRTMITLNLIDANHPVI